MSQGENSRFSKCMHFILIEGFLLEFLNNRLKCLHVSKSFSIVFSSCFALFDTVRLSSSHISKYEQRDNRQYLLYCMYYLKL